MKLQPYDFTLTHISGKDLGLADCLSRFPLQGVKDEDSTMEDDLMVCVADTMAPSTHEKVQKLTEEDEELQELKGIILS